MAGVADPPRNPQPLDYAARKSPTTRTPARTPTPEQLRFRRRLRIALLVAFVLGLIPFPTQVCPALNVRLVDVQGRPLGEYVHVHWHGLFHVQSIDGWLSTDPAGTASLSRQWVWHSALRRVGSRLSGFVPHGGGWGGQWADVDFGVPRGFDIDLPAMGLTPDSAWTGTSIQNWTDPRTGDWIQIHAYEPEKVYLRIQDPGRWGATPYPLTVVLRRRAAATTTHLAPALAPHAPTTP
jgi:hypothetical protein